MKRHVLSALFLCSLATVASCAPHRTSVAPEARSSSSDSGDVVVSPHMRPPVGAMQLRSRGSSRPRGKVLIPVDASGIADTNGIKFLGNFDDLMQAGIREFLTQQTFTPGTRNGLPAPGVFEMIFR